MTKQDASVIIPNWNGLEFIKNCLNSLKTQTFKTFEIIVVDNGSTDGSVDFIKKNYPYIIIIELKKNTGFAFAVNRGIEKSRGEYVILLNNDTEVDKFCIGKLVEIAKKYPQVSFIAAKILNYYKRNILDSTGDYIDEVGHADNIGRGEKDSKKYSIAGPIFLATAGGCLIKKEAFKKVGLLDEDYFMYFEDVDWCFRAQLLGLKGWYEPKAIIYHINKASANRIKPFVEYLQFRNMTMTILKDFPKGLILQRMNWLRIFWVNINTVRYFATQSYLWEAIKAEYYILTNLRKILKKRSIIQKSKVVSDKYIIENIRRRKLTLFGIFKKGI
ncbi:glycosyltransferase family 2 protein [Candidatus Daviesbacteria bacterium]|nr:glycosyltransferase family 2 protein [Candidatus Daviesbacteria bacterium]